MFCLLKSFCCSLILKYFVSQNTQLIDSFARLIHENLSLVREFRRRRGEEEYNYGTLLDYVIRRSRNLIIHYWDFDGEPLFGEFSSFLDENTLNIEHDT